VSNVRVTRTSSEPPELPPRPPSPRAASVAGSIPIDVKKELYEREEEEEKKMSYIFI